jgi:hypothetical protein
MEENHKNPQSSPYSRQGWYKLIGVGTEKQLKRVISSSQCSQNLLGKCDHIRPKLKQSID